MYSLVYQRLYLYSRPKVFEVIYCSFAHTIPEPGFKCLKKDCFVECMKVLKECRVILAIVLLVAYVLFTVPLGDITFVLNRHHIWRRAANLRLRDFEQGGNFIVPHERIVTWGLCFLSFLFIFFCLIRKTAPFSHLVHVRQAMETN